MDSRKDTRWFICITLVLVLGRPDFITFQPESLKGPFGVRGLLAVWLFRRWTHAPAAQPLGAV